MIDYKIIGKRIKKARIASGLTQEVLAEKIDVSTNYMTRVENGYEKPNLTLLAKISVAAHISLPALLTDVVEDKRYLQSDIADILADCSPEKVRLIYDIILRISQYDQPS
ncbi:MAG: helix-turn-helix domain-containing protein [Firmicutes bacterium]|nr:helix-turn-helix domain-containing protein [Bacillota bacterium]